MFRITPHLFLICLGESTSAVDATHTEVIWDCSQVFLIQSIYCSCSFRCTQSRRFAVWEGRLLSSDPRRAIQICLLSSAKDNTEWCLACHWKMAIVHVSKSLVLCQEDHLLEGTQLSTAPKKVNSWLLQKKFRKFFRRFLEELNNTIFATVAARSLVGQGLSCFCPKNVIGGDNYSAFYLLGQTLDGPLALHWLKSSNIKAQMLNSTRLYASSDRLRRVPAKHVFESATYSRFAAASLASTPVAICTSLFLS